MGVPKFGLLAITLLQKVTDGSFKVYKIETTSSNLLKYGVNNLLIIHDVNSHYFLKIFKFGLSPKNATPKSDGRVFPSLLNPNYWFK